MILHVDDLTALPAAAASIINAFPEQRIFLMYGPMGAGKTTFVRALCQALGVAGNTSSPTFSIVNEYASAQGDIYHFDFYRLKDENEAFDMGYEEYFYSGNYCFVEWPEKIPNLLPDKALSIHIDVSSPTARTITVK